MFKKTTVSAAHNINPGFLITYSIFNKQRMPIVQDSDKGALYKLSFNSLIIYLWSVIHKNWSATFPHLVGLIKCRQMKPQANVFVHKHRKIAIVT